MSLYVILFIFYCVRFNPSVIFTQECSIFPSVRCGLEMAILNALAVRHNFSLLNILQQQTAKDEIYERSSSVKICALIDSNGSSAEVAYIASSLVEEGFTAIKLKVS